MKKHSSQALIGTLALILGCVIFLTALIGLTTANSRVVVTDADRLRKAESCERTLANLHKLVVPQIDDVVAYYHQRAVQAEDETLRQRYAEREALFSGLYASGNNSGGRFGSFYSTPIQGVSLGMALTLGRVLGKELSGQEISK